MKCWKCGQEIVSGSSVCVYCGASQTRPAPVTEAGKAMRALCDRYGAITVLSNGAYLVSGLGDLMDDSKKLRNQLKMAMDAGAGRLYLEQLNTGAPDAAFDRRVKQLLTEDAGLSDKAAGAIIGYFDEMIGWRQAARAQAQPETEQKVSGVGEADRTGSYTRPQPEADRTGSYTRPQPEVDRTGRYTRPQPEVDRTGRYTTTREETDRNAQGKTPQPAQGTSKIGRWWNNHYLYEKVLIIYFVAAAVLAAAGVNREHDPENYLDYALDVFPIIPFILSFKVTKEDIRRIGSHGGVLTLIVFLLILAIFILDLSEKISLVKTLPVTSGITDAYLWQRHLLIGDLLALGTLILLFIQLFRHRNQEAKLKKK